MDFAQGLLGAKSPKPTMFLTLYLDSLPFFLQAHRICPDLPKEVAIGKNKDGHWATTSLKAYPPALNRALAECIAAHLRFLSCDEDAFADQEFLSRCHSMHVQTYGSKIGLDYFAKRI